MAEEQRSHAEKITKNLEEVRTDQDFAKLNIFFHTGNYNGIRVSDNPKDIHEKAWLKEPISLEVANPLSVKEIMKMLQMRGVNISSSLPLSNYYYAGFGVTNMPVEQALKHILGTAGLDFEINYESKSILIHPMRWKTYYLHLGNRKTQFSMGDLNSSETATSTTGSESDDISNTDTIDAGDRLSISTQDDFWTNLSESIQNRLEILVPRTPKKENPRQTDNPAGLSNAANRASISQDDDELYKKVTIGLYAINPEVGSIQIQAPSWVLNDFDDYFRQVEMKYNTLIHFTGRLYMVVSNETTNQGVDLSLFKEFPGLSGLDVILQNNGLGGVTISNPASKPVEILTNNDSPGNGMIGLATDSFQLFHAFLSENGNVATLQEPELSSSHGVPAKFHQTSTVRYNRVTQNTVTSETNAAVGSENDIVTIHYGTKLSINPIYNPIKKTVRAQISIKQSIQRGEQQVKLYLTTGDTIQEIATPIPNTTETVYTGEVIWKPGDMVIIGGQKEHRITYDDSGTTKLKDTVLAPLFSSKTYSGEIIKYYFAIKMNLRELY